MELPHGLRDASDLRQVPDNQEVLLSSDSEVTYIIEILESVPPKDLSEAVKFHFNSIAHDNEASYKTIEHVSTVPTSQTSTSIPHTLQGTQLVPKFNRTQPDRVRIFVGLFRVEAKKTDIVFSVNLPLITENGPVSPELQKPVEEAFIKAVNTFKIVDFSLFV